MVHVDEPVWVPKWDHLPLLAGAVSAQRARLLCSAPPCLTVCAVQMYTVLAILYAIALSVWLVAYLRHRATVLGLQVLPCPSPRPALLLSPPSPCALLSLLR